jgi:NAD+ kinase
MLAVEVQSGGPAAGHWAALNEAVLEKPDPGRLVRFEVLINGAAFTSYAADGVIVATPTGSTAYSFSAGGPIVSPRLACFLMTPVSPHMLFDRTLVLDDDEELELRVTDRPAVLTLDGRELGEVEPGTVVKCTCGPDPARMITFAPRDFHQILKAKFGLADR